MDDPNDKSPTADAGESSSSSSGLTPEHLAAVEEMGRQMGKATADATNGRFAAFEEKNARLEATVEALVEIVDTQLRHKGQVHNAAHLDLLELILEDSDKARRAHYFTAARDEMARRTAQANTRR
jgi:hypothetical protein